MGVEDEPEAPASSVIFAFPLSVVEVADKGRVCVGVVGVVGVITAGKLLARGLMEGSTGRGGRRNLEGGGGKGVEELCGRTTLLNSTASLKDEVVECVPCVLLVLLVCRPHSGLVAVRCRCVYEAVVRQCRIEVRKSASCKGRGTRRVREGGRKKRE